MTDHHDPLDDLASASLDGERTPSSSTDRELRARVERLEAARMALRGADAPVDPLRREEAIEAALAAFDEELAPVDHGVRLARSRFRRPPRAAALVGIAAAIALLALAVPLLGRLGSPSKDEVVAPRNQTTAGATSGDSSPSRMMVAGADASSADLGTFSGVDALTAAVRARLDAPPTSSPATGGEAATAAPPAASTAPPCADQRAAGGPEVFTAVATLDGRSVIVVVHEDPEGRTLVVLASDDCTTLSSRRL